jgi:AraC family transcriptional regulator of arabinose operon
MEDSLGLQWSVADLAKAVNLSPWRLCHIFKTETTVGLVRYLRTLRMEQARRLLETTFLSVKEITNKVGARDESHFLRDFKATYGLSPAKYRSKFLRIRSTKELRKH